MKIKKIFKNIGLASLAVASTASLSGCANKDNTQPQNNEYTSFATKPGSNSLDPGMLKRVLPNLTINASNPYGYIDFMLVSNVRYIKSSDVKKVNIDISQKDNDSYNIDVNLKGNFVINDGDTIIESNTLNYDCKTYTNNCNMDLVYYIVNVDKNFGYVPEHDLDYQYALTDLTNYIITNTPSFTDTNDFSF